MIVVDTSVLVAIFLQEPDHETDETDDACVSVVSRLELTSVLCGRRFQADPTRVSVYLDSLHLSLVPVSIEQMALAVHALLTLGKGRHAAKLNLGDCFAYALAKSLGARLLFKGHDFAQTDIVPAWRPSA